MDFPCKKSILAELLKEMGFVYKARGRDRIMYERECIIAWRQRYLRKMMEIRKSVSPENMVYMDETWLNEGHRTKKEWTDLTTLRRKKSAITEI